MRVYVACCGMLWSVADTAARTIRLVERHVHGMNMYGMLTFAARVHAPASGPNDVYGMNASVHATAVHATQCGSQIVALLWASLRQVQ